jgi:hypothetical protein
MRVRRHPVLLLLPVLAACADETPTESRANTLLPCAFRSEGALQVGGVQKYQGGEAERLCLRAAAGGEYTLVPFFASSDDTLTVSFTVTGANVQNVTGPPNPALLPSLSLGGGAAEPTPVRNESFHLELQQRARRELGPALRAGLRSGARGALAPSVMAAQRVPQVGETIEIRVPEVRRPANLCTQFLIRPSRVAAVTQRAIVVADLANPQGFTDAEYRAFGETFDTLVAPVNEQNFGAPSDIDANGRTILYFTHVVNEIPRDGGGFVAGFFWVGDLFPRAAGQGPRAGLPGCPQSNTGEIFYLFVPSPAGGSFTKQNVARGAVGVIGHEFEHLINASRRIYVNNANQLEEPWLDEGLAHIAEELLFYRASGLAPRQNLTLEAVTSSPRVRNALNSYGIDNIARYITYLVEPDSNSLLGNDALPTRGASWAFLRYSADRRGGNDRDLWFNLVNSQTSGVPNLQQVLRVNPIDWMQDWTVSVYTDDAPIGTGQVLPVEPIYTQPSWNFRDVIPGICRNATRFCRNQLFPLKTFSLASAERSLTLQAGGAGFVRFGIAEGGRVGILTREKNRTPREQVRLSIVRTK